jgi:hypothetical protein
MKKLQFKDPHTRLHAAGMGEITNDNLTQDKYDRLVALNPVHADLFHQVEIVEPVKSKTTSKPTKNETDLQA